MSEVPEIPGYTVQHRLAAGRHGGVWAGLRDADGSAVAIKVVQADRIRDASRFLREAAALASIEHQHVVRCLDSGREDGFLWLAMDLAAGDLAVEVRSGASDPRAVFEAGRDAAAGLAELHRRGLVHRDISPANLLRMPDGRVVVGDFGLVSGDHERLTRQGEVLGTPAYISPEQAAGATVDARADVYALGAVLYALATGQPPYQGDNTWGMLSRIAAGPFPDPREVQPELPLQLRAIILAATGLQPEDRYQQAELLAEDCIAALAGGIPRQAGQVRARQRAVISTEKPARTATPHPAAGLVLGALAGAALGVVPGWLLLRPDPVERSDFTTATTAGDVAAWRHYAMAHPGGQGIDAARRALAVLEADSSGTATGELRDLERDVAALEAEVARLRQTTPAAAPLSPTPSSPVAVAPIAVAPASPAAQHPPPAAQLPATPTSPPLIWPTDDPPTQPVVIDPPPGLPRRSEAVLTGLSHLAGLTISPNRAANMAAWDAGLRLWTSSDGGLSWRIVDQPEAGGAWSGSPGRKASWNGPHGFIPADGTLIGWRTRNAGLTWHRLQAPGAFSGFAQARSAAHRSMLADGTIAVVLQDPKVSRSWQVLTLESGSQTWQQLATVSADKLAVVAAGGRMLLLRSDAGSWSASADQGGAWRGIPSGTYEQSAWCADGPRLRLLSWRQGLTVYDGASGTWSTEALSQPELGNIVRFVTDPRASAIIFAVDERSGLLRSGDQGRTWSLLAADRAIDTLETAGVNRPRLVWSSGGRIVSVDMASGFGPGAK
jgi:hypothetical protein